MNERTLAIIKPDGVARNLIGEVISRIDRAGLRIIAMRMQRLTPAQAEGFYAVHREQAFFEPLVKFMTSGPVVLIVLDGENVIPRWRDMMGRTNPTEASPGTIRADLGTSTRMNIAHGSDSPESATFEIGFFFRESEFSAS